MTAHSPLPLPASPQIDIVLPVFNEEAALEFSVRRLHRFLSAEFPFTWRIVIADNASTDATPVICRALAAELPGVAALRLGRKGRGRALRAAWSASDVQVASYMDIDLSTDLRGLLPLVAPLLSSHSDLAIGTRLAHGARVVRGPKRELISRAYSRLLRTTLRARFSDAQCGFKAARTDALRDLLPEVRDDGWFFDTELLVLAQRRGRRIHEVPVDWIDDPDSRVDIARTALDDLRGVARLALAGPVARFMAVGVLSTLAYVLLFLLLRLPLGAGAANAVALAVTAIQHRRQPALHVPRARAQRAPAPPHPRCRRLPADARADGRRARLVAWHRRHTLARARAGRPRRRKHAATLTRYVALRSWVLARSSRSARRAPAGCP